MPKLEEFYFCNILIFVVILIGEHMILSDQRHFALPTFLMCGHLVELLDEYSTL